FTKWVIIVGHEYAALQIHNSVRGSSFRRSLIPSEAGGAGHVICRAENAAGVGVLLGSFQIFDQLFLVPNMITGGEHISAQLEEFLSDRRGDAKAPCSIFAIDDQQLDSVSFNQMVKMVAQNLAARAAKK